MALGNAGGLLCERAMTTMGGFDPIVVKARDGELWGPKWPIGVEKVDSFTILTLNTLLILSQVTVESIKLTIDYVYDHRKSILRRWLFVVVMMVEMSKMCVTSHVVSSTKSSSNVPTGHPKRTYMHFSQLPIFLALNFVFSMSCYCIVAIFVPLESYEQELSNGA